MKFWLKSVRENFEICERKKSFSNLTFFMVLSVKFNPSLTNSSQIFMVLSVKGIFMVLSVKTIFMLLSVKGIFMDLKQIQKIPLLSPALTSLFVNPMNICDFMLQLYLLVLCTYVILCCSFTC